MEGGGRWGERGRGGGKGGGKRGMLIGVKEIWESGSGLRVGVGVEGPKIMLSAFSGAWRNKERFSSFFHYESVALEVHVLLSGGLIDTDCPNTRRKAARRQSSPNSGTPSRPDSETRCCLLGMPLRFAYTR